MWMSDRPKVQRQLAVDLASLVDVLPEESVIPFLDAFWKTMAREWNGIDALRYAYCVIRPKNFTDLIIAWTSFYT